jgi:hypothetical protein
VSELETTLRSILNTQRDYNQNEREVEETKQGFRLHRSMQKAKMVGRLKIPLAQLIDTENSNREFDVRMSVAEMPRVGEDPYTIDIATLPTPMAAPSTTPAATFQDYVNDGCLLDFCVAIDFTSSNGKQALGNQPSCGSTCYPYYVSFHPAHVVMVCCY